MSRGDIAAPPSPTLRPAPRFFIYNPPQKKIFIYTQNISSNPPPLNIANRREDEKQHQTRLRAPRHATGGPRVVPAVGVGCRGEEEEGMKGMKQLWGEDEDEEGMKQLRL